MVLKILGSGFIMGEGAYLKDPWNILDFFIVMTAYFTMLSESAMFQGEEPSGGTTYAGVSEDQGFSMTGFRAFRMLRPLRFVNSIEGLKILLRSVLSAMPLLKDTIIILMFFFLIYAIGGVNLLMGELRKRCVSEELGTVLFDSEGEEYLCAMDQCPEGYFCGKRELNPNNDVTNFDNIFWGMLVVFQCITMEGWSDIMVLY